MDQLRDTRDGFEEFSKEIQKAVGLLTSLEWEAIRTERFPLTPRALYAELVRTAEGLLNKKASELQRRQEWLEAADGDPEDPRVDVRRAGFDRFGLDLDTFKLKSGRKPQGWKKAVKIAGWVCIDEIRALLEMHYDEVRYHRWKSKEGKAPPRRGEYKVTPL